MTQRERAAVLKTAYKAIFAGEHGKIVRKDLKAWCYVDKPSMVPGDPYMTAYNEGARSVYLRICKMAGLNLDSIIGQSDN